LDVKHHVDLTTNVSSRQPTTHLSSLKILILNRHAVESSILSLKRSDHLTSIFQRPIIGCSKNTFKLYCILLTSSKCRTSSRNLPTFDTSERSGTNICYLVLLLLYRINILLQIALTFVKIPLPLPLLIGKRLACRFSVLA